MDSIIKDIKNTNYDALVRRMETRYDACPCPETDGRVLSVLTMDDETLKSCFDCCYERKRLLSHQCKDFMKRHHYANRYQHLLPLEYYLSPHMPSEKLLKIAHAVRQRLIKLYPHDDVPPQAELVFFAESAIHVHPEILIQTHGFDAKTCTHHPLQVSKYCHTPTFRPAHPSDHLSEHELDARHVFEVWPDAEWDWTELSAMPHIATCENVFIHHTNAPWDWYVLSKERPDLATYENVFIKYSHKPWDWYGLSWQKHLATPENVFHKHADKPWHLQVLNHHNFWTIPLLKKYHKAFPIKWQVLVSCNPHLITYENVFIRYVHDIAWNWYAVSACPRVATYENVFINHTDAPWQWSVISQQTHLATYENVFEKHPHVPWDWSVLTMNKDTIGTEENIFVRFPDKPWDMHVVNAREDLVTRKNVFEKYPSSRLWDLCALLKNVDLLYDADDRRALERKKHAVKVIENKYWNCLIDPKCIICQNRLLREFEEMVQEL